MTNDEKPNKYGLPEAFRPLMWSYTFEEIDPVQHKREIIINAINYGDLVHWRWLVAQYGLQGVQHVLITVPITEIRGHVRRLVSLMFKIPEAKFNHAPRGSH